LNHYLLPDGNVQIAFSGGRTSAYMLHHILEANGGLPDRAIVSFQNTGREMPQTLDFVQEVSDRWNVPIVWLEYRPEKPLFEVVNHNSASRNGEPFEALIRKRKYLPNQAMRWETWTNTLGIRADEMQRAKPSNDVRWRNWYPLVDAGAVKREVVRFWVRQPFDLKLANIKGKTPLGNCDGCFLKSEATLAMLARDYPERHAWWERMEAAVKGLTTSTAAATFRKDQPRRELRQFVERQGDWIFDDQNFLCQKDEGECVI
jgi:hypothetical protein